MYRLKLTSNLALIALCLGCAKSPTANNSGVVSIVVAEPITVGTVGRARLVNGSDSPVTIGAIWCYVRTDQLTSGVWSAIPPKSDMCPLPALTLGEGESYTFAFEAPAATGIFRLHTTVAGDSVVSGPFTVR
jgi:hypothetical protein